MDNFIDWDLIVQQSINRIIEFWGNPLLDYLTTLKPILIPSLIGAIAYIVYIRSVWFRSKICGDSKRETRKKVRRAKTLFELLKTLFQHFWKLK